MLCALTPEAESTPRYAYQGLPVDSENYRPAGYKNLAALVEAKIIRKIPKDLFGGEFIIVNKLNAVRSSTLLNGDLRYNPLYLTSKARRFRQSYNRYPYDINELKAYVNDNPAFEFPPHPLGEEYVYDPQTGKVRSN